LKTTAVIVWSPCIVPELAGLHHAAAQWVALVDLSLGELLDVSVQHLLGEMILRNAHLAVISTVCRQTI